MRKLITGVSAAIVLGALLGAVIGATASGGWLGPMPLAAAIFAGAVLGGTGLVVGLALAAYDSTFKSDGIVALMLVGALTSFVLSLAVLGNRIENFIDVASFIGLGILYAFAYKGGAYISTRSATSVKDK